MKKSILSTIALIGLMTVATGYASTDNEVAVGNLGSFIYKVEQNIADFFNSGNKTSYDAFVKKFETIFQDFKRKIEPATRGGADALTKEIYDVIDYALQQFSIAQGIIKKYNGKPSSDATAFSVEIKRDFNTEKVFSEIVSKLKVLKCKATQACEPTLVAKIETVIQLLEKKKKEWSAKADWVLFAGLRVRMDTK